VTIFSWRVYAGMAGSVDYVQCMYYVNSHVSLVDPAQANTLDSHQLSCGLHLLRPTKALHDQLMASATCSTSENQQQDIAITQSAQMHAAATAECYQLSWMTEDIAESLICPRI